MYIFGILSSVLLAAAKKPTTWYIDGNNLMAHKGTVSERELLAERLKPIQGAGAESIVLVFDGRPGEKKVESVDGNFRQVELAEGISSDNFILEEIQSLASKSKNDRIQVVTADRELRKFALASRPSVKGVVNPVTFWKKYLPRMAGLKKPNVDDTIESFE